MSNKEIVGKWFNAIWGGTYNPEIIAELAHENMVMKYPLHGERTGHKEIKEMLDRLREAFPDLCFKCTALVEEGDYIAGCWEGGGTHTGPEFSDLPAGCLPENSGRAASWTGMSVFRIKDGKIEAEIGEEDAFKAAIELGLITIN